VDGLYLKEIEMNTRRSKLFAAVTTAAVLLAFLGLPAAAQTKPAAATDKLEELVGDYNFEMGGESLIIHFTVEKGQFFGAPEGEAPEELMPVKDQPLCFDVTVASNGQYYFLKFVRNEKGVVDTCIMTMQGMEVTGKKIGK
jgi:hypothetical protein